MVLSLSVQNPKVCLETVKYVMKMLTSDKELMHIFPSKFSVHNTLSIDRIEPCLYLSLLTCLEPLT